MSKSVIDMSTAPPAAALADASIFDLAKALAAGQNEALPPLLNVWIDQRSVALGALIDHFGGDKDPVGAACAAIHAPGKSKQLIARVKDLEQWGPDPRVASVLIGLVENVKYTAQAMKPMWTSLFRQLTGEQWDPRVPPRLKAVDVTAQFGTSDMTMWMEKKVAKALDAMNGRGASVLSRENDVAALVPTRAPAPEPSSPGHDDAIEAELLATIAADLDNNEARLVYADFLMQRGQADFGEFVTLQVRRAMTGGSVTSREEALLKKAKKWFPLGPLITKDDYDFDRGLLDACRIYPRKNKVQELAGHPLWSTVRWVALGETGDPAPIITHPVMRNLHSVKVWTYPRGLAGLLDSDASIEELRGLYLPNVLRNPELWRALTECTRLPNLRLVQMSGATFEDAQEVWSGGLDRPGMQFLMGRYTHTVPPFLAGLPENVTLLTPNVEFHVEGDALYCTVLDNANISDLAPSLGLVGANEGNFPAGRFQRVVVRAPEQERWSAPQWSRWQTEEAMVQELEGMLGPAGAEWVLERGTHEFKYLGSGRLQL